MHLIVLPEDGIKPLLKAIDGARKTLDLIIFRFDLKEVEKAIEAAVPRGVNVRALIAHTHKGSDKRLRELELRMLAKGVTVSRTGEDLIRYHGKMMIIDKEELHILGYNYTSADLKSRSFGLVTREPKMVKEAVRLFEADAARQEFEPAQDGFVVSPENAREQLATFIKRAKKSIAIYVPHDSDNPMLRVVSQKGEAGEDVRVIGKARRRVGDLHDKTPPTDRLHVRSMFRNDDTVFFGSQSLRGIELEARREVGMIARDQKV